MTIVFDNRFWLEAGHINQEKYLEILGWVKCSDILVTDDFCTRDNTKRNESYKNG